MENMNRSQGSGVRSQNQEIRSKRKSCLLPLASHLLPFFLLLTAYCLLPAVLYAAQEMLKTQKVKVGEKIPLTDALKKINEDGKMIALLLLSNPMQCNGCDKMISFFEEEAGNYKDSAVFMIKGGQDVLGAVDEDTIVLKRLYGFISVGEPWTFFIDREGILRKIFMGPLTPQELKEILNGIIGRKE